MAQLLKNASEFLQHTSEQSKDSSSTKDKPGNFNLNTGSNIELTPESILANHKQNVANDEMDGNSDEKNDTVNPEIESTIENMFFKNDDKKESDSNNNSNNNQNKKVLIEEVTETTFEEATQIEEITEEPNMTTENTEYHSEVNLNESMPKSIDDERNHCIFNNNTEFKDQQQTSKIVEIDEPEESIKKENTKEIEEEKNVIQMNKTLIEEENEKECIINEENKNSTLIEEKTIINDKSMNENDNTKISEYDDSNEYETIFEYNIKKNHSRDSSKNKLEDDNDKEISKANEILDDSNKIEEIKEDSNKENKINKEDHSKKDKTKLKECRHDDKFKSIILPNKEKPDYILKKSQHYFYVKVELPKLVITIYIYMIFFFLILNK